MDNECSINSPEEIIFIGMDLPKEMESIHDEIKNEVVIDMNDNERKAYELGFENAKTIIQSFIDDLEDTEILIHKKLSNDKYDSEEFFYEELYKNMFDEECKIIYPSYEED